VIIAGGGSERGDGRDLEVEDSSIEQLSLTATLSLEDLQAIAAQLANIRDYDANQMAFRSVRSGGNTMDLRVLGHSERAAEIWNRGVISGRFLGEDDLQRSARVALVGSQLVDQLFDGDDPVGRQIRIGTAPFQVIGVLEPLGVDPHGMNRDLDIIVPLSTAMRRLMNVDFILSAKLRLHDETRMAATATEVREILRRRHHLTSDEPDDFQIITAAQVEEMLARVNQVFSVLLPALSVLTLVVGGFLVASLMLITINERRAEIGLRKALGARRRDILVQVMIETSQITVSGGLFGFLLGAAAVRLLASQQNLPIATFPWPALLAGVAVSLLVGLLASVLPARRAAALQPVESLS
jgi:putative ABC transport system permease protein